MTKLSRRGLNRRDTPDRPDQASRGAAAVDVEGVATAMPRDSGQAASASAIILTKGTACPAEGAVANEFGEVWRQFEERARTKPSLAARLRGAPATSDYLVFLIALDREPAVAVAARRIQACLDLPYVNPVPRAALHITIQSVGYRDELTLEQQAALVERGAPVMAGLAPFEATIGGANSFDVAAFLEVHDGGALREARAKLRAALPWLAEDGRDPLVRDGLDIYLPHVSIAYYNCEADARGAVTALAPHRHDCVAQVRVASVKLVAVRLPLSPRGPRYRVEECVRLGRRGPRRH
jgi:2'-5' RNA ligase